MTSNQEDFVFGSVNVTTFLKRGDPNGIVPTAVHFGKVFEMSVLPYFFI
jgi:hypothetical protein